MRDAVNFAKDYGIIDPLTYGINIVGSLVLLALIWSERKHLDLSNYTVIAGILLYVGYEIYHMKWPAERIHFIEYGLLGIVAYLIFRRDFIPFFSLLLATLLVTLAGWGDETIQYFLPSRVYDLRDVAFNGIGGLLGALLLAAGLPHLSARILEDEK